MMEGALLNFHPAIPIYSSSQFPVNPRSSLYTEHGVVQLAQTQGQSPYSPLCTQYPPRRPPPGLGHPCHLGRDWHILIHTLHLQMARTSTPHGEFTVLYPHPYFRVASSFDKGRHVGDTPNTYPSGSRCTSPYASFTSTDVYWVILRHLHASSLENHAQTASSPGVLLRGYAQKWEIRGV